MVTKYIDIDTLGVSSGGGGSTTFSGDISGTSAGPQTVTGLQGRPVSSSAPTTDQVLQWNGTAWAPATVSGGDAAPKTAQYITLAADPTLTNERVLTAGTNISIVDSGAGNPITINNTYTPVDATSSIKGIVQLAGDLGGTAASPSVVKINGANVPVAGSLVTGTLLQVDGASSLGYAALNLGSANSVTGILPAANMTDSSTSNKGIIRLTNDLGGTADGPIVTGIRSVNIADETPTLNQVLQYNGTDWAPASISSGAPQNATYLVLSADSTLTNERILTAGTGITFVDGGAGSTLTINGSATAPDASTSVKGIVQLAGDLGGTAASPSVLKINTTSVSAGSTSGQVLRATGTNTASFGAINLANNASVTGVLAPANMSDATTGAKGIVQLAGNLGGTAASPTVTGIRGVTVSATTAIAGQYLVASSASAAAWTTLPDASTGAKGIVQLTNDLGGTATSPSVVSLSGSSGVVQIKCVSFSNTSTAKITPTDTIIPLVSTTNATPTTLYTYTLTNSATTKINIQVVGIKSDNTQAASYDFSVTVRANTGVYNLVGSVSKYAVEDNTAWDCEVSLSTNTLLITVTGVAATNISWGGTISTLLRTY